MEEKESIREILKFSKEYNKSYKHKLNESLRIIKENVNDFSNLYWSGGRDSTVLLHLMLRIKSDINIIYHDTGVEFLETRNYINQIIKEWDIDNIHIIKSEKEIWNLPPSPSTRFFSCTYWLKILPNIEYLRNKEINNLFFGDRGEEDIHRILKINKNGGVQKDFFLEKELNRKITNIYPIAYWSDEDIENYLNLNNIRLNELYSLGYHRVGCKFCPINWAKLKTAHPNIFNELKQKTNSNNIDELWDYFIKYFKKCNDGI